jgi:CsoR family transcriptional regulator, copper-sensing transcriptional repressor
MKCETVGDKLIVQRSAAELTPFKQRLARIEGQVRGLKQMIEDNRYCGEAIQQSNAVIAAIREVALMLISQQLQTQVERLNGHDGDPAQHPGPQGFSDFVEMLRSTYRLQ